MTQVGVKAAVALTCVLLGMAVLAVADTVEVAAVGVTFQPPDVIINEGDSVHWTGLSLGFHTVAEVDDAAGVERNQSSKDYNPPSIINRADSCERI